MFSKRSANGVAARAPGSGAQVTHGAARLEGAGAKLGAAFVPQGILWQWLVGAVLTAR